MNSTGNRWVSTRAARLLITHVETMMGLGLTAVEVHLTGVCKSISSEFRLKNSKTVKYCQLYYQI